MLIPLHQVLRRAQLHDKVVRPSLLQHRGTKVSSFHLLGLFLQFQLIFFFLFAGITLNQVITNRLRPLPFIIRTRPRQHQVITSPRFPTQRLPLHLITPKRTQLLLRFIIRQRNQSELMFYQFNYLNAI